MKYIMYESKHPVHRLIPIVFPAFLVHQIVHEEMLTVLVRHGVQDATVRSAGEYNGVDGECSGRSVTLKVHSHPDDTNVIATYSYLHGIIM